MLSIDFADFVPSGLAISALLAVAYFFRDRIGKLIDGRVEHHYNAQLERLKDELSRNAREIEALRSSVLELRGQRQANIEKRRLEAIDQLWGAVKKMQLRKGKAVFMSVINFEPAAKRAMADEQFRKLFETLGGKAAAPDHDAHDARPYVSPLAWALFNAYEAAISYLDVQLTVLRTGVGPDAIKEPGDMIKMLAEALPEWQDRLETHGTTAFPYVIDDLENRLLSELRRMLAGEDDDAEQVEKAARILSRIEKASQEAREAEAKKAIPAGDVEVVRSA